MSDDALSAALLVALRATKDAEDALREVERQVSYVRAQRDEWKLKAESKRLQLSEARERIDDLEDALDSIAQWAEAYPLEVFPVPDFLKCAELLKAGGETLDSITASVLRRAMKTIGAIASSALRRSREIKSNEA